MEEEEILGKEVEEEKYFELVTKKARLLYSFLPDVGFTHDSFETLGRSIQQKVPFDNLRAGLKGIIIRLVAKYDDGTKALEIERAITESVEEETELAKEETKETVVTPVVQTAVETPSATVVVSTAVAVEPPTVGQEAD